MVEGKGLLLVKLDVSQMNTYLRIGCTVTNIGDGPVYPDNTYLFVDEGIYNESSREFEFPFFQEKFLGLDGVDEHDCIGCAKCKHNDPTYPSDCRQIKEFYKDRDVFCKCYPLKHLSSKSMLYLGPNETMNEEIVLKLDEGVYRAILMCVPKPESCDCVCCNRCFCVTD